MSIASRRTKWHPVPPPPPSPKIHHFPLSRRTRYKQTKPTTHHRRRRHHHQNNTLLPMHQKYPSYKGKLETLFDRENSHSPTTIERRERVEEVEREDCGEYNAGGEFEEEKWRFQAEILRAECNLLRMEREFALKKQEKNRVKMERTLKSAVQTLVSGKEKIFEGKNVNAVLEEEIKDLAEKLEELQKSSRSKDSQMGQCGNFDKKATLLQRRLEKLGGLSDENCTRDLQESSTPHFKPENKSTDVDVLRKKMEGLAKGMLDRVEEDYNSMVSISTANSSVASSASTSKRMACFSSRQLYQEAMPHENKCSGRCKAIVRRIVEQVRAETEQWSQMQEMLALVRAEMEDLQASHNYWENRALNSDIKMQSLKHAVDEWKGKALDYESKINDLQLELSLLKEKMQRSKVDLPLAAQLVKERLALKKNDVSMQEELDREGVEKGGTRNEDLPLPLSLGKQLAKEKRMLFLRLKENRHANRERGGREKLSEDGMLEPYVNKIDVVLASKRSSLRDIGNVSALERRNCRVGVDFHSPESLVMRESFRR